jgi:hypothetical protein
MHCYLSAFITLLGALTLALGATQYHLSGVEDSRKHALHVLNILPAHFRTTEIQDVALEPAIQACIVEILF